MKKYLLPLVLLLTTGCNLNLKTSLSPVTENTCPDKPPKDLILLKDNVKEVNLSSKLQDIGEGQISSSLAAGYTFQGKSGQKIEYKFTTPGDSCIWIITPSNQVFTEKTLKETGYYIIQLSGLKGQKQTYSLSMGLDTDSTPPSPTAEIKPSPSPSPLPPSSESLSQADAVQLIKEWYTAKNEIFGRSYDESTARRYATGTLLYDTIEKCNDGVCGGSVGWLKEYGCYYTYSNSQINDVVSFSASDDRATLVVGVRETLQLHGSKSAGCGKSPQTYNKNATYWLKKEAGTWKIYKYEVGS